MNKHELEIVNKIGLSCSNTVMSLATTQSYLGNIAERDVYARRHSITRGVRIVKEAPIMRHFTVGLEPITQREAMLVTNNGANL